MNLSAVKYEIHPIAEKIFVFKNPIRSFKIIHKDGFRSKILAIIKKPEHTVNTINVVVKNGNILKALEKKTSFAEDISTKIKTNIGPIIADRMIRCLLNDRR
jgi:hypothetical protein